MDVARHSPQPSVAFGVLGTLGLTPRAVQREVARFFGSKGAAEFVRGNQALLATRPVWLFSSGPLGTASMDDKGWELLVLSEPKEFKEFNEAIKPRGVRVFFGALNPSRLGFSRRAARLIPAARAVLPEGDFRDWAAIDGWAESIASELARLLVPAR
jgi:menaquinone-dependent protoporphyrinogen oxidase